ncbi:hypothetical protein ACPUVO_18895 [Pseudocolwellia sp. HL-MZ19]|uniref:hypothetical protein n=1 Tax=Pseudocolwellia sp. HL-MZ19 TaxID=3400846 RepID=UPI003CF99075
MKFLLINRCVIKLERLLTLFKSFLYYLNRYETIKNALKKNNVLEIKPLYFRRWHLGCAYFLGSLNGEKVFIKIDTKLQLLKNEKVFYDIMHESLSTYVLPLHFYYEERNLQIVCFSYADGRQELNSELILNNPSYLTEIISILKKIKMESVIHRDIKLDNFIMSGGNLNIIDFTFSYGLNGHHDSFKDLDINISDELDILKRLGSKYKPKDFLWNDFISLKNIVNEIIANNHLSTEQMPYFELIVQELDLLSENAYYTQTVTD